MKPVRFVQFGVQGDKSKFNSILHSWANNRNELYFYLGWSFVVTDPYVEVFQWGADWWCQQWWRSGYLCCYTAGRWSASYRLWTAPEGRERWPTHPLKNSQTTPQPAPESHLRNSKGIWDYHKLSKMLSFLYLCLNRIYLIIFIFWSKYHNIHIFIEK